MTVVEWIDYETLALLFGMVSILLTGMHPPILFLK